MNYSNLIEVRDNNIQGETNWHWIKTDKGAFGHETDGPMRDWTDGHSKKYFTNVKNFGTVITAGANCGMHVRFYAKMFKHVYAFEPDPLSFHCMVLNSQFDNVIKFNTALGKTPGVAHLNVKDKSNVGTHKIDENGTQQVAVLSIDSLNVSECDLIQLDVEGYEMDCLLGALETIKKFKPVLVLESFGTKNEYLENLGYKFQDTSFSDSVYIPI